MSRMVPIRCPLRIASVSVGLLIASATSAVTVVVTSAADVVTICASTGHPSVSGGAGCTLRDAILFSNANPQQFVSNLIQFNIPGGFQDIGLGSLGSGVPLPAITTATIIDGYSQPGASPNTLAVGDNAVLMIRLFGDNKARPLLHVAGGTGGIIKGLVLNGGAGDADPFFEPSSIVLDSPFNVVAGNFIAIASDGNSWSQVTFGNVKVNSGDNVIGGSNPADRNLLGIADPRAFNGLVELAGAGNRVQGNYFGLNAAGSLLPGLENFPSNAGIYVTSDDNFIGGSPAERNVIGGCGAGIYFDGGGAFANVVEGNFIGTDAAGNGAAPVFTGAFLYNASGNFLGASTAGNRIAFNDSAGIKLDGSSQGNTICCSSIFSNGQLGSGLGIDLDLSLSGAGQDGDGPTPNDPGDLDGGPNGLQNFPVLTQASSDQFVTNILGTLNSLPNTSFRIQFFSNGSCNPSGYGEGESFIGESFVGTDGNGYAAFNASPLVGGLGGQFITSTATNLSTGDTSEFSACLQAVGTQGAKVQGTIHSVDPDHHSFVLTTASGAVTILTDDTTKFRKNHKTVDFSALAVGDLAVVKGTRQSDGSVLAKKVTVGGQEQDEVE